MFLVALTSNLSFLDKLTYPNLINNLSKINRETIYTAVTHTPKLLRSISVGVTHKLTGELRSHKDARGRQKNPPNKSKHTFLI